MSEQLQELQRLMEEIRENNKKLLELIPLPANVDLRRTMRTRLAGFHDRLVPIVNDELAPASRVCIKLRELCQDMSATITDLDVTWLNVKEMIDPSSIIERTGWSIIEKAYDAQDRTEEQYVSEARDRINSALYTETSEQTANAYEWAASKLLMAAVKVRGGDPAVNKIEESDDD